MWGVSLVLCRLFDMPWQLHTAGSLLHDEMVVRSYGEEHTILHLSLEVCVESETILYMFDNTIVLFLDVLLVAQWLNLHKKDIFFHVLTIPSFTQ